VPAVFEFGGGVMGVMRSLRAPFPYFGGKCLIAGQVWERLGDVANYVEPFFGSGAVLLSRPHEPRIETVNDADGLVSNFWRAIRADPEEVGRHADWPVIENDVHARHAWVTGQKESLQLRLEGDPEFYDAKVAGWWVWLMSCSIGSGLCSGRGPWQVVDGQLVRVGSGGHGVSRRLVHLGNRGRGVNRQLVHLSIGGQGVNGGRGQELAGWFEALAGRLRGVRVCCGDWSRVCGPSVTVKNGLTGVFLDPPYSGDAGRDNDLYRVENGSVANDVREWALKWGGEPGMRIALCGYEGEHEMPGDWECVAWKAQGGYGSQNRRGNANAGRERVWFSPGCLQVGKGQLALVDCVQFEK
jgi:site-specific DNA-adenine methylase